MARRHLAQATPQRARAGQIFENEEVCYRTWIDREVSSQRMGEHRPRFGAEHQCAITLEKIERLLAEAVAHEIKPSRFGFVEGEGEHTVDLLDGRPHAIPLKKAEQDLGV